MDKQEKRRDVAVFSNMMKDLMNKPLDDSLVTLDRDIQHFIYGRIATLVRHNQNEPIGSVGDISAILGAALADVLKEFLRGRADDAKLAEVFEGAKLQLVKGFDARKPQFGEASSDQTAVEEKEAAE
jgi:hypothetical protein